MVRRILGGAGLLALVGLVGCVGTPAPPAPTAPAVIVSQPVERAVTDYALFTGRTAAVQSVEVRARVSGYLQDIAFQAGQEVKQGQLLFQIEPTVYQAALEKAQADVKQYQAQVRLSESELQRSRQLTTAQAIAPEDVEKIVAQRDQAVANLAAANAAVKTAQENVTWTKVVAPVSGRTSVNLLTKGNLVVADQTMLTTIVSQDPMWVYFDVDTETMLRIKQLILAGKVTTYEKAEYPVDIGMPTETGFSHKGRIDYVSNQVNPGTGTLNVRGTFPNPDRIVTPGLYVRVRMPVGPSHQALLVTDRALGSDQGQPFLLTVDEKDQVVRRDVKTGALHDGLREITAGLGKEDWVIVDGLLRVRPGVTAAPKRQPMPEQPAMPEQRSAAAGEQGSKEAGGNGSKEAGGTK
jgi:RND family efflux transporter MFP subunit